MVTPHLKGFHLTLASHHPGRDKFSWKVASKEWAAYLHEAVEAGKLSSDKANAMEEAAREPTDPELADTKEYTPKEGRPLSTPPQRIDPVPRLKGDLLALTSLFHI
jgi:hypothetical protein